MRVLVAPDKFKGSLTAAEVADAVTRGLTSTGAKAVTLPLADGGDGSVAAALTAGFGCRRADVRDADRVLEAEFALREGTAVVEVANTCGLATLTSGRLAPMTSSSYPFGQAVLAALQAGARQIVLALGGSASTDGGAGLLAALGARFLDAAERPVEPVGHQLGTIAHVDTSTMVELGDVELVVATDVTNPLLGADGAAAVFGPQKGADIDQVRVLEAGLANLVRVLPDHGGRRPADLADEAGAGAAGGLGFACRWLGAHRVPGAEFFLDLLGFDDVARDCDVVVTGEGCMDSQTLGGKLPAIVARRSSPRPVYAVVGRSLVDAVEQTALGLRGVYSLSEMTTADPSIDPGLSRTLATRAGTHIANDLRASVGPRRTS
jgi:glycerate kinase